MFKKWIKDNLLDIIENIHKKNSSLKRSFFVEQFKIKWLK